MRPSTDPPAPGACCPPGEPPASGIDNRPGQPSLAYRIGTHGTFLRRLQRRLLQRQVSGEGTGVTRPLQKFSPRTTDDPTVALLDAWAAVADVLSFYQERIANEGYLLTATEDRSVRDLVQAIGYEPRPGAAAQVYLAFTGDDKPGAPGVAAVPRGTLVQSLPAQDQQPQSFETAEDLWVRPEWNALRPRQWQEQRLEFRAGDVHAGGEAGVLAPVSELWLRGTQTGLRQGDLLLLCLGADTLPGQVQAVEPDLALGVTWVALAISRQEKPSPQQQVPLVGVAPDEHELTADKRLLTESEVRKLMAERWQEGDLQAFLRDHGWDPGDVLRIVSALREAGSAAPVPEIYALRTRTAFFGHNAPRQETLPRSLRDKPYKDAWDDALARTIWTDSQGNARDRVYLERPVPEVVPDSWVVFEAPLDNGTFLRTAYRVRRAAEVSLADYAVSGRAMALEVVREVPHPLAEEGFLVRRTTAHVYSERLHLSTLQIRDDLPAGSKSLVLDRMVLGLRPGQLLILRGEPTDPPGVVAHEVLRLAQIVHQDGLTTLVFQQGLLRGYRRCSVTLSANVVAASHGETVREVLGSGDAQRTHQRFPLKKPPLTYLAAASAEPESSLQVWVDGVQWRQVRSLLHEGPQSESFLVRVQEGAEGPVTEVRFGDGQYGARLGTGRDNVSCVYRSGIGLAGEVGADRLQLLGTRPLGVTEVTNPLPASGAADPERMDQARAQAPRSVQSLSRVVSLRDYEDFAATFPGIGKARAVMLGGSDFAAVFSPLGRVAAGAVLGLRGVYLTIAAASGAEVTPDAALCRDLRAAIDAARDPVQRERVPVAVVSYQRRAFNLQVRVLIDPRREQEPVLAAVRAALLAAFSFERRGLDQPVRWSEVIAVIHGVAGVQAVAREALTLAPTRQGPALCPRKNDADLEVDAAHVQPAQLFVINPGGLVFKPWEDRP